MTTLKVTKMKFLLLLLILQSYKAEICQENLTEVEYYEEIIKKNILKSLHYKLPTSANEFRPKSDLVTDFGEFDFIIIGAGAAGGVIANRLSEIKNWKILLLEAGGDVDDFVNIPAMRSFLTNSKYNWNFITTAGNCLGAADRRCPVMHGKALGGSSVMNDLIYGRGHKEIFNKWKRDGNKGWSYKDVLPYFVKSENCQIDGDPGYHGKGGYWNVKNIDGTNIQLKAMMKATKKLFNYTSTDYNGKCSLGMFIAQTNHIRGQRQSIARAFLIPFEKRKNLFILRHAYATKILIENKITRGVEFAHKGTLFHAFVKKEVIVSAGGIQSPQLLMLSGIGPKEDLKKLNISLIKNLPVGRNILDQLVFGGLYVVTNYTKPVQTLRGIVEKYVQNKGELTVTNSVHGVAFYQTNYMNVSGVPDIRISIAQSNSLSEIIQNITNATVSEINGRISFIVGILLVNALSAGTIKLKEKDPYTYPLIDPKYLSNAQDLEVLYEAVEIVKCLIQTPEMKRLNASLNHNVHPQCRTYNQTTKDYWFCIFRYSISSVVVHGIGGCRMGSNLDTSVVNSALKVHGIEKLRVAGESIIPSPVTGVITTVVMMAEKISDSIKRHYNEPVEPINNVLGFNN